MFEKTFNQIGTFKAWYAAETWLSENGYSYGSTCAVSPYVGVLKGEYCIAKWRNLTSTEKEELDGVVTGNFREGPVVIRLRVAPGVAVEGE